MIEGRARLLSFVLVAVCLYIPLLSLSAMNRHERKEARVEDWGSAAFRYRAPLCFHKGGHTFSIFFPFLSSTLPIFFTRYGDVPTWSKVQ